MASKKLITRNSMSGDKDIPVEKQRVPKTATHFEALAEKARGSDISGKEAQSEKAREEAQATENAKSSLDEIAKYRATAQQNSIEAIRGAKEKYVKTKESAGHGGLAAARDKITGASKTAAEYTAQTAEQAKDYALQKAAEAKDAAVNISKEVGGYAEEKAVAAKDYTCEKAVEATKVAADAAHRAAEFAGETALVAKEVAAGTGYSAIQYAGEKVAAAKEAAISSGERAMEYTAKKKEEAKKEADAKKSSEEQDFATGVTESEMSEDIKQEQLLQGIGEQENENAGGLLEAIGETIIEIAQTAKNLFIGQGLTTEVEGKVESDAEPTENIKQEQKV
ncbi:hypothetical protein HHK36_032259 [Tetracentron sinense]|uniref:Seed biotin-containing protein SBP65-like n=1 Tax=Tetracentron sinense TaxID=13715 RepID=A0A834YB22_TETSI|nr:hypothetical protein HHK36_032259 [Tetracentron sinense]